VIAGIAHNVNTPLGVSVSATSFLQEQIQTLHQVYEDKQLSDKTMNAFLSETQQTMSLLSHNINRASDLISSFKQFSVDQTSETQQEINLLDFLNEVIKSLAPNVKNTQHTIDINCADDIIIQCAPDILAQIFTHMVMNSLIHGFENIPKGTIKISIIRDQDRLVIDYQDNGKGVPEATLEQHFDVFFSTDKGKVDHSLGTHILYNLVAQTLGGDIEIFSKSNNGLRYKITIPV